MEKEEVLLFLCKRKSRNILEPRMGPNPYIYILNFVHPFSQLFLPLFTLINNFFSLFNYIKFKTSFNFYVASIHFSFSSQFNLSFLFKFFLNYLLGAFLLILCKMKHCNPNGSLRGVSVAKIESSRNITKRLVIREKQKWRSKLGFFTK